MPEPTLDPKVEIPKDAPLAMGHDVDDRDDAREASQDLKDAVDAEAKTPDVGARAPGDHAAKKSKKSD